jgi:tRNA threonylcarbamoyladenosine biosynthesis protein TsaE
MVAHVDVYRLERVQDVVDLGLEEIGDGNALLLVEWGDAVQEILSPEHLQVSITTVDPTGADETRQIELWGEGPSWDARWDRIATLGGSRSPA